MNDADTSTTSCSDSWCQRSRATVSGRSHDRATTVANASPAASTSAARRPLKTIRVASSFARSRSPRATAGRIRADANVMRAANGNVPGHAPQERHDAVPRRHRAVDVERRHDGSPGRHDALPTISSRTDQKSGQLFDTTSGSVTSIPSTDAPSTPKAIARRWS